MKKNLLKWCAAALAAMCFTSCAKDDGKTLYLFNWTYYTPDTVIKQFEQEFGVKVKVDSFASNEEMFAKLKAGASGYDIVFPSQDYVSIMIKEDMLREIDRTKLPNAQYISPLVLEKATYDPDMKYSVPYYMGAAGVAVNKTKVTSYEKSWNIFARTDLKGRMCMMDDMREVIGDALAYMGKSVNSLDDAELNAAKELVITEWKPNLVKFDAEGFGKSFAAGDFWVVQGYAEVVFGEVPPEKWNTVDFFIPREGGPMYIDSMCILKNAKHYDLAMEFINFIQRPEVYAQFLDEFRFPPSVNTEAHRFMKTEPMYTAEEMAACEIKEDVGAGLKKFDTAWQDIRFTE
ncbi:extracellular solute-binding protein [Treponema brennaborense]|uniref:Extracellular solute-binding protein family 1 n=1 Tax=Treponema brennaborense (strain DSM 12168 / CIP 105900 / DD5/3) TaxID=906968 RepID=F4LPU6_TREBD|nr:extracellular solute-binding protein [Treponema brennaborense]AEE16038.1 extracellular solute-binding protein family 1 [Treponema brennaborense DSM 12168]